MGKLINVIPDSRFLISCLPGSALRTHKNTHLVFSTSVYKFRVDFQKCELCREKQVSLPKECHIKFHGPTHGTMRI